MLQCYDEYLSGKIKHIEDGMYSPLREKKNEYSPNVEDVFAFFLSNIFNCEDLLYACGYMLKQESNKKYRDLADPIMERAIKLGYDKSRSMPERIKKKGFWRR